MTEEKFLSVTDTSATAECPIRKHHIFLDGIVEEVTFEYGKPTILPYIKGAKFVLPGFIVRDAEDKELSLPSVEAAEMAEDEVIAKLSELHDDALRLRAISRVGGESFAVGEIERDELIAFLISPPVLEGIEEDFMLEDEDGISADTQDNLPVSDPEDALEIDVTDVGGEAVNLVAEEIVANDDTQKAE